jgi:hypothetical protein
VTVAADRSQRFRAALAGARRQRHGARVEEAASSPYALRATLARAPSGERPRPSMRARGPLGVSAERVRAELARRSLPARV